MNIALDWDGTYTADPELWNHFVRIAIQRGHVVTVVTWRSPQEKIHTDLPVIYCSRTAKRKHVTGIDIWIDDYPEAISNDETTDRNPA